MVSTPGVADLTGVVDALRDWQYEGGPVQLHPGDVGWYWRFGAESTADVLRTWSRAGRLVAVGMLDGPRLLRLAISPDEQGDEELARELANDAVNPERGVLPAGEVSIEARSGGILRDELLGRGWQLGEPWTPLVRDLTDRVEDSGIRIETIGADDAAERSAVHRAAFDGSVFTEELWHTMAAGAPYVDARCLVAFDGSGAAVAGTTVWSAGPGRPGLLEPLGVHRDHRGHGYGTAITIAAASALRELGSSSATVCTPSSNVAAVAAYRAGGFEQLPDARDLHRAE